MSTLPVSVRLALWGTRALAGALDAPDAVRLAAPDADHVEGASGPLATWRDLGERVVLPALPRPGHTRGLPRGDADFVGAATDAGECVFAPMLGGALVPEVEEYGPVGDAGLAVRWRVHDVASVPARVLDAWSLRDVERELNGTLAAASAALEDDGAGPFASRALREVADERIGASRWGLPDGVPARAARLIRLAAIVATAADLGLDAPDDAVDRLAGSRRRDTLIGLRAEAEHALSRAAGVAALHLAGLRGGRED